MSIDPSNCIGCVFENRSWQAGSCQVAVMRLNGRVLPRKGLEEFIASSGAEWVQAFDGSEAVSSRNLISAIRMCPFLMGAIVGEKQGEYLESIDSGVFEW
jgi:hypothetical protein